MHCSSQKQEKHWYGSSTSKKLQIWHWQFEELGGKEMEKAWHWYDWWSCGSSSSFCQQNQGCQCPWRTTCPLWLQNWTHWRWFHAGKLINLCLNNNFFQNWQSKGMINIISLPQPSEIDCWEYWFVFEVCKVINANIPYFFTRFLVMMNQYAENDCTIKNCTTWLVLLALMIKLQYLIF